VRGTGCARLAGADEHCVLPHQVRFDRPVTGEDQKPAGTVEVEGVMHGMVGVHLVDQPDLEPLSDAEPPVDCRAVDPSGAIEESPVHGRGRTEPIDSFSYSHSIPCQLTSESLPAAMSWCIPAWWWYITTSSWCIPASSSCVVEWFAIGWVGGRGGGGFMPRWGQRPGWSLVTSGCMGQGNVTRRSGAVGNGQSGRPRSPAG